MLSQKEIVTKLLKPSAYPHQVEEIKLIETNISWVFLTGKYAYKMKKRIKFGDVLDFSTLAKRLEFCKKELELNKRLAPSIYLSVVPINKKGIIEGRGEAIEYLVKMKQLPQTSLLTNIIGHDETKDKSILETLARKIALFHKQNTIFPNFSVYDSIYEKWDENFRTTKRYPSFPYNDDLENRVFQFLEKNKNFLETRKEKGKIVDGHGDLILSNIFFFDNTPIIFDCIEFNPMLRIQDTLEEIGFLAMDLDFHNLRALSDFFLKQYFTEVGEVLSVDSPIVQFYKSYRAYVRAKVYSSQLQQEENKEERKNLEYKVQKYMEIASSYEF
ncbi:MAG: hypothetical protein ACTSSG_00520 [Candidatus Heimdallarchaeaceae archaeon]